MARRGRRAGVAGGRPAEAHSPRREGITGPPPGGAPKPGRGPDRQRVHQPGAGHLWVPRCGRSHESGLPGPAGRALRTARVAAVGGVVLAFALAAGEATACDSSSCALVTRGQGGLLAKRAFRIDVSYRYTDDAVLLDRSSPAERGYPPKVAPETR